MLSEDNMWSMARSMAIGAAIAIAIAIIGLLIHLAERPGQATLEREYHRGRCDQMCAHLGGVREFRYGDECGGCLASCECGAAATWGE